MKKAVLNIISTKGFRKTVEIDVPETINPIELKEIIKRTLAKNINDPVLLDIVNTGYGVLIFVNGIDLNVYVKKNMPVKLGECGRGVIDVILIRYGG